MEFKNGYNFIYEKRVEAVRKLFASKIGRPDLSDEAIDLGLTDEEIKAAKLFYETKESIMASASGIPTADDKTVSLTINGEPVIGPSGDEPGPKVGTPFEISKSYQYCYYNKDLSIEYINSILESLDYTPVEDFDGAGMLQILDISGKDYYALCAIRYPRKLFDPTATGCFYAIMNDYDEGGEGGNGLIYLSESINPDGSLVEAGWHVETPGKIYIYDERFPTILAVNEWDKVNTIFSSTPFDGPAPSTGLNKLKVGDLFTDIHFDTTKPVSINDFNCTMHMEDMEGGYILGAEWYMRGETSDTEYFAIVATHIPAGGDVYGQHFDREYFTIITAEGDLLYFNDYAKEMAVEDTSSEEERAFYESLPVDKFFADSLRSIAKLYLDADIPVSDLEAFGTEDGGDLSYGKVMDNLGEQVVFDYSAPFNGKNIGFKEEDYFDPTKSLGKFEVNTTIHTNDAMRINLADGNEDILLGFLSSLQYSDDLCALITTNLNDHNGFVFALHPEDTDYYSIISMSGAPSAVDCMEPIYSNATYTYMDAISFVKGLQNVDDTNRYRFVCDNIPDSHGRYKFKILELEDPNNIWNGKIIGTAPRFEE